jgi:two-component system, sensor histidine kinase and response regulator
MDPKSVEQRDAKRLSDLHQFAIHDSVLSASCIEFSKIAAQVLATRFACVAFVDGKRIVLKSPMSVGEADVPALSPLLNCSFEAKEFFLVEDTARDPLFQGNQPVVSGQEIRSFAAFPIRVELGLKSGRREVTIGLLAAFDAAPRKFPGEQLQTMRLLADQCSRQIEQAARNAELSSKHAAAELALKHSEAFYHSLVETIPQNIFRKDLKGRFTFANSNFCRALNKKPEEIIGKTDFDLFPPELAAKYQQDDRRVLDKKVPLNAIEQHRDSAGNTLYVQVIKSPLFGAHGDVTGIQGIFWDETERYKAEEALAYERELLRAMLDNIPDSIYFKDRDSRFLAVSRSLAMRLGLDDPADAVGKTDADFFGEAHAEEALRDERAILRSGQPLVGRTEREIWLDGRERWVLSTKVPLKNPHGEITGTFGISKDITDLKNAEAELSNARDSALESARLKSEFLANMSHEIRTPLNAVIGMTGLLLETDLSAEQRDFAETIRNSADSLLAIINDILDFSKIEAGKMAIETIDFDLNEVVEGTAELLAERAQTKNVELASWIHGDVPRHLRGDPGRIRQVLTNLVGNAVKFTHNGEVVLDVRPVRETDRHVLLRFAVKDTGIGISEEAQGRLFQAFVQADGSTTRRFGGTGLGLAICKQLVELMHGDIGFESVVGKGSTFWFTLALEKQAGEQAPPAMASTLEGFHVLIVDDNETNREIVHHQILSWKMRNGSAQSGSEALKMLEKAAAAGDPYEIAVLDMQMPEMDGLTLARAIKANPAIASTQLIMLTSLGYLPEESRWREAGIAAYLVKPVKESRLYDALVTVLRGSPKAARIIPKTFSSAAERPFARILIAEDNTVNQKVALRQLQKLGYAADAVANGLEVLEAVKRIPYDLILMDCQMPELDGYEATRMLRSEEKKHSGEKKRHYIVAMTANALSGDREECLRAGMDDYISKPVRLNELESAIARGLENIQKASADPDADLLDHEILQSVRDLGTPGESDPLPELIELFMQDTPIRIGKLLDAFKAGDVVEVERAAHSLKGSSNNLGAKCLAAACLEVMNTAKAGKLPDSSLIAGILSEFERLKPALEREKNKSLQ